VSAPVCLVVGWCLLVCRNSVYSTFSARDMCVEVSSELVNRSEGRCVKRRQQRCQRGGGNKG
jgi:hypothetical protein